MCLPCSLLTKTTVIKMSLYPSIFIKLTCTQQQNNSNSLSRLDDRRESTNVEMMLPCELYIERNNWSPDSVASANAGNFPLVLLYIFFFVVSEIISIRQMGPPCEIIFVNNRHSRLTFSRSHKQKRNLFYCAD